LIFFVGGALLVLGCILICYILLLRYKAVRLQRTPRRNPEQDSDDMPPSEAGQERRSWWWRLFGS
jgi:hypothetical protein